MNCKNCGARLKENSKVCPNCGAFIDDGSGYVLLTDNYRSEDVYSDIIDKPQKKHSVLKYIISLILVAAIVGAGAYYYFTNIYNTDDKPSLSFTSGSGIINDDEPVVYVGLPENSRIEFIHGVELYDYDKTDLKVKKDSISSSYEYTKSIDGSFRTIFFDTSDITVSENTVLTFEMKFSFVDSEDIYTYYKIVELTENQTENIADIIFDHSLDERVDTGNEPPTSESKAEESTTEKSTTAAAPKKETPATQNISYIYNSFWFTEPVSDDGTYDISAIKFNNNGTYNETQYHKQGDGKWKRTNLKGKYEVRDNAVFTTDSEGQTRSYPIKSSSKALDGLTSRKYNSIKNAEDFFGL